MKQGIIKGGEGRWGKEESDNWQQARYPLAYPLLRVYIFTLCNQCNKSIFLVRWKMVDRKWLKKPAAKGGAKSKARTTRSSWKNVDDDESDFESNFVELEIEEFEEVKSEGQQ